jgi:hypothetical protein
VGTLPPDEDREIEPAIMVAVGDEEMDGGATALPPRDSQSTSLGLGKSKGSGKKKNTVTAPGPQRRVGVS